MAKKKTKEEYVEELKIKNPDIILTGDYINNRTSTEHYCTRHKIFFNITPTSALAGCGCKFCKGEKVHNTKVRSEDKYIEELSNKNPTVQYISGYINTDTPALHYCLIHDVYWNIRPYSALQGCGCPSCRTERISSTQRKPEEAYISELKEKNPNLELADKYINSKTPIRHRCKKHDVYFDTPPAVALQGCGCPQCWKEKLRDLHLKPQEQYVQELKEVQSNIILIGEYNGIEVPTTHKCLTCGNEWISTPHNILLMGSGCPKCNISSKGEKQIGMWLDQNDIQYVQQKTFEDCIDKRKLPFDYYLTEYNTCIEYQGIQHYKPVDFFGGEKDFLIRQHHDEIKKRYCIKNNINLICIPYWENVNEYLNKNLLI